MVTSNGRGAVEVSPESGAPVLVSTSMSLPPSAAESSLLSPSCGASGCALLRRAYRVTGVACVPGVPAVSVLSAEDAWFRSWMLWRSTAPLSAAANVSSST